jgi:hypothetical protein
LIALPAAVAVPLTVYQGVVPLLPERPNAMISSLGHLFIFVTLAGAPGVALLAFFGWSVIRRRWKNLAILVGHTILMSFTIAVVWLWAEWRLMSDLDHYSRSEWFMVIVPGTQAVGLILVLRSAIKRPLEFISRLGERSSAADV